MAVTYIKDFTLPGEGYEVKYISTIKESGIRSFYPFNIFPRKELHKIHFEPVTIFYGGNGSGKTTLLNLIGEKAGAVRRSPFNSSRFFGDYVSACGLRGRVPSGSEVITSDDVFEYVMDRRRVNGGIDEKREEIFKEFTERKYSHHQLGSLEEYDIWKESVEAKRKSRSQYVRDRLADNIPVSSNGESAMGFFTEKIKEGCLYLLDEPENSLSIELQKSLSDFLSDSARYFGCQLIIATHSPLILSMRDALVYNLDSMPAGPAKWTELPNVRAYFDFFMEHREEFENCNS